jgi:hypothetical protein
MWGRFLMGEVPLHLGSNRHPCTCCAKFMRHTSMGAYGRHMPEGMTTLGMARVLNFEYRGTSPIRKRPPVRDPPRTLGIGLR